MYYILFEALCEEKSSGYCDNSDMSVINKRYISRRGEATPRPVKSENYSFIRTGRPSI